MNRGSGSVTAITGCAGTIGTGSPNCAAMAPDQAPAQFSKNGARSSRPVAVVRTKTLPSCAIPSTLFVDHGAKPRRSAGNGR